MFASEVPFCITLKSCAQGFSEPCGMRSACFRLFVAPSDGGSLRVRQDIDPLRMRRGLGVIVVVPVPPLVRRGLRVTLRRVLPVLLRRRQSVTQVMKAGAITYKKGAGSIAPGLEPETRGLRIERGRQPGSSDYLRGSPGQSPAGSRKFRARTGPCPMGRATDCGSEC